MKMRCGSRDSKKAQTMTEYIVIVCLLAVGSIFAVQQLSNVVRAQIGQAAHEIAGSNSYSGVKAEDQAKQIDRNIKKSMDDFWKNGSSSK